MQTIEARTGGSWLRYNGYADVAFDEAQIGRFRKAEATLASASRQGISSVLTNWVRGDMRLLQGNG